MRILSKSDMIAIYLLKGKINLDQAKQLIECDNIDDFEPLLADFLQDNDPNADGNGT